MALINTVNKWIIIVTHTSYVTTSEESLQKFKSLMENYTKTYPLMFTSV